MTLRRHHATLPARAAQQGFTLIEIIIVIVLIGLIATIVGGKVLGAADRAKFKLAKTQVQTLANKVEQYQQDVGSLPADLEALVKPPSNSAGWLGPYAKEVELKDPWNHPMEYHAPGEGGAPFDIVSLGHDGKPGGDSYDAYIRNE